MARRAPPSAVRGCALLLLALVACAGTGELRRAGELLGLRQAAAVPALREEPPAPLGAPEGLHARSGELRAIPLVWEPLLVGEVGGYVVERAAERQGPFERVAVLTGRAQTSVVDRVAPAPNPGAGSNASGSLADGATFYYRVRAFTPEGSLTSPSPAVAATTAPPPAPPEDLRAYSLQPRYVPLRWSASEDPRVAGYVLYRSPTSRGPFEPLREIEGRFQTAWVDRNLGDLRVFYYRVSARNTAGGEGSHSEPVRAVTKPEPLPPIGLRAVERALGRNRLAWEPNVERDVAEYRLLRFRQGSESPELVAVLPAETTSAEDAEVRAGEPVAYALVARDRDGLESAPSQRLEVESEGYDLAARVGDDGVHLTWRPRAGEGFLGARVLRSATFGQRELAFAEGGAYVDTSAEPGARYRYTVVLERPDGTRAPASASVEIQVPEA